MIILRGKQQFTSYNEIKDLSVLPKTSVIYKPALLALNKFQGTLRIQIDWNLVNDINGILCLKYNITVRSLFNSFRAKFI